MTAHNYKNMTQIKHMAGVLCLLLLGVGLSSCLEKDAKPGVTVDQIGPFAFYKMNVSFIDALSKEPIPNLGVLLLGYRDQTIQITDADGKVQLITLAHPPTPKTFELSYTDPQKNYADANFYITFTNPVFKNSTEDALKQGPLYRGLAEISITKELNLIAQ